MILLACMFALSPPSAVAITGVTLIDGAGGPPRAGTTVIVDGGRIAAIGDSASLAPPPGARVVDGRGQFLVPGLWDGHVHLATRKEPRLAEDVLLPAFLAHGIVGVRDMGGDPARVLALRAAVAAGTLEGPEIVTPGPFVDAPPPEADALFAGVTGADDARAVVAKLKADGVDFVKVQAGLSPEAHAAVVREAAAAGLRVEGHVPEAISASLVATSGQRTVEHVSPALPGDAGLMIASSAREADLRAELLALRTLPTTTDAERAAARARRNALMRAIADGVDPARRDALFARLVERDVVVVPTLVWSRRLRPLERGDLGTDLRWELVPRALRDSWKQGRARFAAAATDGDLALARRVAEASTAFVRDLHRAGVRLAAGTDAFDAFVHPGASLHEELELLVSAGLTPMQALQSATTQVAAVLGRARSQGRIAVGQRADLVLLQADPLADIRNTRRIAAVVKDGRLYDRAALDGLLAGVARAASH